MAKPLVALVGRPNVGKSTLFNRLVGDRVAIVEDVPGTTRDRLYGEFEWRGRDIAVVDTGGMVPGDKEEMTESIYDQAAIAIEEADVIVFMVDQRTGISPLDEEISNLLRRAEKPVILAVNKTDNVRQEMGSFEFHALGLGEPQPVSSIRGLNTGDLLDRVVAALPAAQPEDVDLDSVGIAIVGRPNVGKSSLVNSLLGQPRLVVSETPGTTRDAVDTELTYKGKKVILIDTAGIRRRGKVGRGIEKYSVIRALRAIDRADVAVLLIDATEPVASQDAHVAGFIQLEAKGVILAINKWDLITKDTRTMAQYERAVREHFKFLPYAPTVFISAQTGQRIENVIDLALSIQTERRQRVSTGMLNEAVRRALAEHQPPSTGGRLLKIFYVTQVSVNPPTFVFKVNDPELVHFGYQRFLENQLRERFGFFGTPIKLIFRPRGREERG